VFVPGILTEVIDLEQFRDLFVAHGFAFAGSIEFLPGSGIAVEVK